MFRTRKRAANRPPKEMVVNWRCRPFLWGLGRSAVPTSALLTFYSCQKVLTNRYECASSASTLGGDLRNMAALPSDVPHPTTCGTTGAKKELAPPVPSAHARRLSHQGTGGHDHRGYAERLLLSCSAMARHCATGWALAARASLGRVRSGWNKSPASIAHRMARCRFGITPPSRSRRTRIATRTSSRFWLDRGET